LSGRGNFADHALLGFKGVHLQSVPACALHAIFNQPDALRKVPGAPHRSQSASHFLDAASTISMARSGTLPGADDDRIRVLVGVDFKTSRDPAEASSMST
jgi:hypothetical protein